MDFATGFATGFAMGKKMFEGGGGGNDYINNDPDYALYKAMPDPDTNQLTILIRVAEGNTLVDCISAYYVPEAENISDDEAIIDWGDGTTSGIGVALPRGAHTYSTAGDYIITVTIKSEKIYSIKYYDFEHKSYTIALKIGSSVRYDDSGTDKRIATKFKYIQFSADYFWKDNFIFDTGRLTQLARVDFLGGYKPKKIADNVFNGCYALDFHNLMPLFSEVEEVGNNTFMYCYNLKRISLPNCLKVGNFTIYQCHSLEYVDIPKCTEIGERSIYINYALKEVNIPMCNTVGTYGLAYNTILSKINISNSCNYGKNAMQGCSCLIPTPNGIYPY